MGTESIEAVLWDLDDTICRYPATTADRLADAFEAADVPPFFTAAEFERWIPRVVARNQLDLRERCFTAIAREKGVDPDRALAVAAAFEDPDPRDVRFVPGAEAALEALSSRYSLGLVTNGSRDTQRAKLETLGIAGYFETAVFATPEKALKPEPEPFRWALEDLAVPTERAVYVGNSLQSDVTGANATGLRSVWVRRPGNDERPPPDPDYTVDSPADLQPPPWTVISEGEYPIP